jgi:chromosome segregation ATPase
VIHGQVRAYRDQILSITDEKREIIDRLETSQEQIRELNDTIQALSAQYRESLALRQTEQTEHDDVVRRHRNLELDHAETLRTLELRNSQLDEVRRQHDTEITPITEERDRLREALPRITRKLQRAQASLRNLRDNFPNNAEALLSAPHQIHGLVLTKDGRPDRRYRDGKPFSHFSNEKSSVLHDGRRTYLLLTAVSE